MFDFVVKFGLAADDVEAVNELRHYFAGVVSILGRHHADKQHDSFDEARILKVQVYDKALKNILVLLDQVLAELFEKLSVPLDNCLLSLAALLENDIVVLLLEPEEDVLELFFFRENLDDCAQDPTIYIFYQSPAIEVCQVF